MAFKAKKLNIDLTLDLTEYIPEKDGGILKTEKTDSESIREWLDIAIREGEKLQDLQKDRETNNVSISELSREGEKSVIKQIDYFYNKGEKYYKQVPPSILRDILEYINAQIYPVKKK